MVVNQTQARTSCNAKHASVRPAQACIQCPARNRRHEVESLSPWSADVSPEGSCAQGSLRMRDNCVSKKALSVSTMQPHVWT